MKKKQEVTDLRKRKLRLSRETLRELKSSEAQKVEGGAIVGSPRTDCPHSDDTDCCTA